MRARLLHLPAIARAVGFVLVAAAIIAAALHFQMSPHHSDPQPPGERSSNDPLAEELKRCQLMADQAKDDPHCEAVWAENRRRFFTYAPASTSPTPAASATNNNK